MSPVQYTVREEDWIKQEYRKELHIDNGMLKTGDGDLHDYILRGISEMDESELSYIFGIENPTSLLTEDETLGNNIRVEDFAIRGTHRGKDELAIGQVVSANRKNKVASLPFEYRQVNGFGHEIRIDPSIESNITGYYIVCSDYEPEEVRKHNRIMERDLRLYGRGEIGINIYRIEPDRRNEEMEEAVRNFYSSLTHS